MIRIAKPINIKEIPRLPTNLPNARIRNASGFTNRNSHRPDDSFELTLKLSQDGSSSKSTFIRSLNYLYMLYSLTAFCGIHTISFSSI